MIDQAAYAAACDERSYGEPTCPHSDEQNMGGECEACYVKRTATPTITKDTDAVSIIYAFALSDKVRWRVTLDGRVLDPRTGEAFGGLHQSAHNGYSVSTVPYAGWVAEREIEWVETCECPPRDHWHVRR